jgi:hypothetical protein
MSPNPTNKTAAMSTTPNTVGSFMSLPDGAIVRAQRIFSLSMMVMILVSTFGGNYLIIPPRHKPSSRPGDNYKPLLSPPLLAF